MSRITTPINQKRFTNVAIVKLKKGGKRFEVAAYCNKVVNWRNGVETDVDEVLQIEEVFANSSRGVVAKAKDLIAAFGTDDRAACCRVVLEKGELQVGDLERKAAADSSFRDIAKIVAEKCVNPGSLRPYPVTVIERAMRGLGFAPNPNRGGKQQALELIARLQAETDMPIERARMHVRVAAPREHSEAIASGISVMADCDVIERKGGSDAASMSFECECLVLPACFRQLDELLKKCCGAQATLEVLRLAVQQEGEVDVSEEVLRQATAARAANSAAAQKAAAAARSAAVAAEGKSSESDEGMGEEAEAPSAGAADDQDSDEGDEEGGGAAMLTAPSGRRAGKVAAKSGKAEQTGGKAKSKTQLRKEAREARKAKRPQKQAGGKKKGTRGRKTAGGFGPSDDEDEGGFEGGGAAGAPPVAPPRAVVGAAVGALSASTAPGHAFESREALRKHFSSDWHKCNLKRKVAGLPMFTLEEFSEAEAGGADANAEANAAEVDREFFS